jgi:hypothetical protein
VSFQENIGFRTGRLDFSGKWILFESGYGIFQPQNNPGMLRKGDEKILEFQGTGHFHEETGTETK